MQEITMNDITTIFDPSKITKTVTITLIPTSPENVCRRDKVHETNTYLHPEGLGQEDPSRDSLGE